MENSSKINGNLFQVLKRYRLSIIAVTLTASIIYWDITYTGRHRNQKKTENE